MPLLLLLTRLGLFRLPKCKQSAMHVGWQRRLHHHAVGHLLAARQAVAVCGGEDVNRVGVERSSLHPERRSRVACDYPGVVASITNKREAELRKMLPYLMPPPAAQLHLHVGDSGRREVLEYAVARDGIPLVL